MKTNIDKSKLCPINGSEWTFEDHRKIFYSNIQGSNCYSYALNHPEANGIRSKKSVPGDIALAYANIKHKFTDWQNCDDAIERILSDGEVLAKKRKLELKNVIKPLSGTLKKQMKAKPQNGWRKFILVVDSDGEQKGTPTDFHFYAQNKIMIDQIYNMRRYTALCCERKIMPNPYEILNINAFCSDEHLKRSYRNYSKNHQLHKNKQSAFDCLIQNRALVNIMLHEDLFPEYAHGLIVDPWWIFNIRYDERSVDTLNQVSNTITRQLKSLAFDTTRHIRIVKLAKKMCMKLLAKEIILAPKHTVIGHWSHKLGWGTEPLNTDGNGKIILDPSLPPNNTNRHHGGYDYDTACKAFVILRGYGSSSP